MLNDVDTTMDGYKYVGINLTKKQYEDLNDLSMLLEMNENRMKKPVFTIMLVLKTLGLLPAEMVCDISDNQTGDNSPDDTHNTLERKFGKITY